MNKPSTSPLKSEIDFPDIPPSSHRNQFLRLINIAKDGRLLSGLKRRLMPFVVAVGKSALRRPWIKRSVLAVLNTSPELKNRLYRLAWKDIALAPRAMRIYTALSTAIPTHSKGNE